MSKVTELRQKIKDLEREARYQALDYERLVKEAKFKAKEEFQEKLHEAELRAREFQVANKEMEKRWDESVQKQLSDILKALVVKLPTLEIKELHAHSEKK